MNDRICEQPLATSLSPVPQIGPNEALIKVKYTGICGTDWSIYNGWYAADKLPMIPGHEFSGVIARIGKNTRGLKEGDRVTADINMSCGTCFYCMHGQQLLCDQFTQLGITPTAPSPSMPGRPSPTCISCRTT